jgi:hypothetical protein
MPIYASIFLLFFLIWSAIFLGEYLGLRELLGFVGLKWNTRVFQSAGTQYIWFFMMVIAAISGQAIRFRWSLGRLDEVSAELRTVPVLAISAFYYCLEYSGSINSNDPLVFISTIALGSVFRTWLCREKRCDYSFSKRRWTVLASMFAALGAASVITFKQSSRVSIGEVFRHGGPWENPNTLGVLVAVAGIIIATGIGDLFMRASLFSDTQKARHIISVLIIILAICWGLAITALYKTYSRGSWLAAITGYAYLIYTNRNRVIHVLIAAARIRRLTSAFLIALATGSILFVGYSEHFRSRVLSVADLTDLSWRNRIEAWIGGCNIIFDNYGVGVGWSRFDVMYDAYYKAEEIDDSSAIRLNDYLRLAGTIGVPSAILFVSSIVVGMRKSNDDNVSETEGFSRSGCVASCIVFLITFAINGGLFKLEVAAPFWVLWQISRPYYHL